VPMRVRAATSAIAPPCFKPPTASVFRLPPGGTSLRKLRRSPNAWMRSSRTPANQEMRRRAQKQGPRYGRGIRPSRAATRTHSHAGSRGKAWTWRRHGVSRSQQMRSWNRNHRGWDGSITFFHTRRWCDGSWPRAGSRKPMPASGPTNPRLSSCGSHHFAPPGKSYGAAFPSPHDSERRVLRFARSTSS
jgi:hypothetical protein